jgi:hypothetical protein
MVADEALEERPGVSNPEARPTEARRPALPAASSRQVIHNPTRQPAAKPQPSAV